jgi:phage shock protein PspC (stress-responsive transcriptional regulator)
MQKSLWHLKRGRKLNGVLEGKAEALEVPVEGVQVVKAQQAPYGAEVAGMRPPVVELSFSVVSIEVLVANGLMTTKP